MSDSRFYYGFYNVIKTALRPFCRIAFGIKKKEEIVLPDGPCLVLVNHACYFDPIIVSLSIRQPLTYVITENLLRNSFMAMVFLRLLHCVPCSKGNRNVETVREMSRRIRDGQQVLMFPEGNMTYDGATAESIPATGKLVRILKCPVVTIRLKGSYQVLPRWSGRFNAGKVRAEVVNVYKPEDFKKKSVEYILKLIKRDLYVEQPSPDDNEKQTYKRKADGLHYLLYACPACGKLEGITEHGSEFGCSCGRSWRLNRYGLIEGGDFETLYEWNRWQEEYIRSMAEGDEPIRLSEPDTELHIIADDHKLKQVDHGTLTMTREYLECGHTRFLLKDIFHVDTRDKGVLLFSLQNGTYYEIESEKGYPGLLYKTLFNALISSFY